MTIRHEIYKALANGCLVAQCINCHKVRYFTEWYEFSVPKQYRKHITGSVCPDCFGERELLIKGIHNNRTRLSNDLY